MLDHVEGDVWIAVVDALCARRSGDHRKHHDPEAVNQSCSQQGPAQTQASDSAEQPRATRLHGADRLDGVVADERRIGPRQRFLEGRREHHLGGLRELVNGFLLFGPELVLAIRNLPPGGEARHQAVGIGPPHQVGDLRLLAKPCEVLRPPLVAPPETRPSLARGVTVEGGDEVDQKLRHVGVLSAGVTNLDRPEAENSPGALRVTRKPFSRPTVTAAASLISSLALAPPSRVRKAFVWKNGRKA